MWFIFQWCSQNSREKMNPKQGISVDDDEYGLNIIKGKFVAQKHST